MTCIWDTWNCTVSSLVERVNVGQFFLWRLRVGYLGDFTDSLLLNLNVKEWELKMARRQNKQIGSVI